MEDGTSKKNTKRQNVAMIGVNKKITQPPNPKRIKPNQESGSNIDTIKLNQKSTLKLSLQKQISFGEDYNKCRPYYKDGLGKTGIAVWKWV